MKPWVEIGTVFASAGAGDGRRAARDGKAVGHESPCPFQTAMGDPRSWRDTAFLVRLDATIAPGQEIHVVLDNGSSHTAKHTRKWLAEHPCWTVHWTPPHASWLNQIGLYFSAMTRRVLRHGDFTSRDDLIDKLETYVIGRNETAAPYRWTYDGTPLKVA